MPLRPGRTAAGVDPNAAHDELVERLDAIDARLAALSARLERLIIIVSSAANDIAAEDRSPSPT